jgi:hypothetical protein
MRKNDAAPREEQAGALLTLLLRMIQSKRVGRLTQR